MSFGSRARWACSKMARSGSTGLKILRPTRAGTARFPMSTRARSKRNCKRRSPNLMAKADAADCDRDCRWNVDARRTGAARGAAAQDRRGAHDDRGAGEGAPCARDGGARSQDGGARGEDRGDGQEAWRQAAEPPVEGRRPSDQVNLTDEESRIMPVAGGVSSSATTRRRRWRREACWWWRRTWFRRPTSGEPSRADAGEDRGIARGIGEVKSCWRTRAIQPDNVEACTRRASHAGDRDGPPAHHGRSASASRRRPRRGRNRRRSRRWRID